jgi:hypothetical protein
MACDGTSVFWTQLIGGDTLLLQHDLGTPTTAVDVLLSAGTQTTLPSLGAVAADANYVYVVAEASPGKIQAVPRGAGDGGTAILVAPWAMTSTPLVAYDGGVCYMQPTLLADIGVLSSDSASGLSPPLLWSTRTPMQTFALDGENLFFGNGASLVFEPGAGAAATAAQSTSGSIQDVAVGGGYVAFSSLTFVEVAREP